MVSAGPLNQGDRITDNDGNVFKIQDKIGNGVMGVAYLATVEKVSKKNMQLASNQQVVVKAQLKDEAAIELQNEERKRELYALKKENTLLAVPNDSPSYYFIVQTLFPGDNLLKVIYSLDEEGLILNKNELSPSEKENIAVGILREYAILQKLNLVHCDIKTDNFLYDSASKTIKLIDMGQSFVGSNPSPHKSFQAPGLLFKAPERYPNNPKLMNSSKTDLYNIGILIASLYSKNCYDRDANAHGVNPALTARETLYDVLGDEIERVEGMPDQLFKIVRHLTKVDPNDRAQSIALAQGASEYDKISDIVDAHQREILYLTKNIRKMDYMKSSASPEADPVKHKAQGIVNLNVDLTLILNELCRLSREHPDNKELHHFVEKIFKKVEKFNSKEASVLQSVRVKAVSEHKKNELFKQSLDNLLHEAENCVLLSPLRTSFDRNKNRQLNLVVIAVENIKKNPGIAKEELSDLLKKIENLPDNKFRNGNLGKKRLSDAVKAISIELEANKKFEKHDKKKRRLF